MALLLPRVNRSCAHDFLGYVRHRAARWRNRTYVWEHNVWQSVLGEKLIAKRFALSMGLNAPRVRWCDATQDAMARRPLPSRVMRSLGGCYVVKSMRGWNTMGTLIVVNHTNVETGARIHGGRSLMASWRTMSRNWSKSTRSGVYVEDVLMPAPSSAPAMRVPVDYKFFVFGPSVVSVGILYGRFTSHPCMAWVDADFRRVDLAGCVCSRACRYAHCPRSVAKAPPAAWRDLLAAASRLGDAIDAPMRVDLYLTHRGAVSFGEITPFHTMGVMHCHVRRRRDGSLDACELGRAWHAFEGRGRQPPAVLRDWKHLTTPRAACRLHGFSKRMMVAAGNASRTSHRAR